VRLTNIQMRKLAKIECLKNVFEKLLNRLQSLLKRCFKLLVFYVYLFQNFCLNPRAFNLFLLMAIQLGKILAVAQSL